MPELRPGQLKDAREYIRLLCKGRPDISYTSPVEYDSPYTRGMWYNEAAIDSGGTQGGSGKDEYI